MSATTNTWADSWTSSQQALMKAMFPVQAKDGFAPETLTGPLHEQFTELQDTWKQSIEKWTDLLKQGSGVPLTPDALREFFAPAQWSGIGAGSFDAGLRQVLEGPKYATLFDLDRKLLELQQLATRRDKDVAAFQQIVLKSWNTAFERFSTALAKDGATPSTWRATADRWLSLVNDTLVESQRSEAFVEAQAKMLRSASDYRLQERKIAEAWCEALHVPTRTEMDEMQRTVTELRRQLRMLQRNGSFVATTTSVTPSPTPKRKRGAVTKTSSSDRN